MSVYGGLLAFTHCVNVALGQISHIFIVKMDTLLRLILVLLVTYMRQSTIDFGRISHIFPDEFGLGS